MTFAELTNVLTAHFGADAGLEANTQNPQPYLIVPAKRITDICRFLRNDERLFFDFLACMTGIDNGPQAGTMEVVYHLTSIPYEHDLTLKVIIPRTPADESTHEGLPVVPSVTAVWRTADWHEREIYDLVGIYFEGHHDLRRILLPTDWVGHPLRKDYKDLDTYHGIKVN